MKDRNYFNLAQFVSGSRRYSRETGKFSHSSSRVRYFIGGRRHRLSTAEVNSMPMKILKDR
jgi:hypothetical protein